jgi:formamidopyrimidine-DNA glycosylase
MPELPEVEVVRSGLASTAAGRQVVAVSTRVPALRWPMPPDLDSRLAGRVLRGVARRGKYLLLGFDHGCRIVHLGRAGTIAWTRPGTPLRAHDHLDQVFEEGVLRLNDPRRFGAVRWHDAADGPPTGHPLLASLGIEPFDEAALRGHLAAHGIEAGPAASRYGAQGEGPSLYLTDPEGNVVELKGPPTGPLGAPGPDAP